MTVESVTTPQDFNVANPVAGDVLTEGDNHARNLKVGIKRLCWEHVGTASFSGAASASTYSLIGTFVAGYDYQLAVEGLYLSAAAQPFFRVTTGGGTADTGSNYTYSTYQSTTAASDGTSATTRIVSPINVGDAVDEPGHFEITIFNPMGTTNPRHVFFEGSASSITTAIDRMFGVGMYITTTAVDGLVVTASTATVTGTAKLYRRFRPT